jgi:hypothetical protein
VLVLRAARDPRDQIRERLRVQQGVGVDGRHQRRGDALEGGVERVVLAGRRLDDPPVLEPEPLRRLLRALGGAVRRVVVGQDDLQRTGVREPGDPLQGRHDRPLLVPGRDDHGHRRPLPFLP